MEPTTSSNDPNCARPDLFIDLTTELKSLDPKVHKGIAGAGLGLAFHPKFAQNRYCYIFYILDSISGERLIAHKLNCVRSSSWLSPDWRGSPIPGCGRSDPKGSMSASGQLPGRASGAQRAIESKCSSMPRGHSAFVDHTSQTSSEILQSWAMDATSAARPKAVGPGDRLSTIGRPDLAIARWIIAISAATTGRPPGVAAWGFGRGMAGEDSFHDGRKLLVQFSLVKGNSTWPIGIV